MLERLASMFPSTCTIERKTITEDATSHEATETWAQLSTYAGLRCARGPASGSVMAAAIRAGIANAGALVTISVAAEIPLAQPMDRVVVTGQGAGTYEVYSVTGSSHGAITRVTGWVVVS